MPVNVTFGNRPLQMTKMRSSGSALVPSDWYPYKEQKLGQRDRHAHGRMPCEDWNQAATSRELPEAGRGVWNRPFPRAFSRDLTVSI